ncbi:unnamed protein product, partial [Bubo scandiacus]
PVDQMIAPPCPLLPRPDKFSLRLNSFLILYAHAFWLLSGTYFLQPNFLIPQTTFGQSVVSGCRVLYNCLMSEPSSNSQKKAVRNLILNSSACCKEGIMHMHSHQCGTDFIKMPLEILTSKVMKTDNYKLVISFNFKYSGVHGFHLTHEYSRAEIFSFVEELFALYSMRIFDMSPKIADLLENIDTSGKVDKEFFRASGSLDGWTHRWRSS